MAFEMKIAHKQVDSGDRNFLLIYEKTKATTTLFNYLKKGPNTKTKQHSFILNNNKTASNVRRITPHHN